MIFPSCSSVFKLHFRFHDFSGIVNLGLLIAEMFKPHDSFLIIFPTHLWRSVGRGALILGTCIFYTESTNAHLVYVLVRVKDNFSKIKELFKKVVLMTMITTMLKKVMISWLPRASIVRFPIYPDRQLRQKKQVQGCLHMMHISVIDYSIFEFVPFS